MIACALLLLPLACSSTTEGGGAAGARVLLSSDSLRIGTGDSVQLVGQVVDRRGRGTGASIDWRVADSGLAQIVAGDWLRGLRTGRTVIIATAGDAVPDTISIEVEVRLTHTIVRPDSLLLTDVGDSELLSVSSIAFIEPESGAYHWTSRNAAIATVTPQGEVQAVRTGITYIVAREAGGTADSALVRVETPLMLSFDNAHGGVMLEPNWQHVALQFTVMDSVSLTLTSSDPTILETAPAFVAPGDSTAYVSLIPRDIGTVIVRVEAPGFRPDSGVFVVGRPRLRFRFAYTVLPIKLPLNTHGMYSAAFESEYDTVNTARSVLDTVRVRLRSSDPTVFADEEFLIEPGESYVDTGIRHALKPGTVWLFWEAPGFLPDSLPFEFLP